MGISIDRLSMMIGNCEEKIAEHHLHRFGFSQAEISEIISQTMIWGTGRLINDWKMISINIKNTIECSVRIGNRSDFSIG